MAELVCCLGVVCCPAVCLLWGCQRCCRRGTAVSDTDEWKPATEEEFHDVPRVCRVVLAAYEKDLANPEYADRLILDQVVKRADYKDNEGMSPPYLIYIDHEAKDICLAIRGLNTANLPDYRVLMDHKRGSQKFDGGYVHRGLVHSAAWLLKKEYDLLAELATEYPDYTVTLAGHSLGSGIAAMMAVLVKKEGEGTPIHGSRLRCYAIAPARTTSLNLAVRYSDTVNAIILQNDFLPRTLAPIEDIFGASFCLPCLLAYKYMADVFMPEAKKLKDPERLFVPGRLYHVIYTEDFSCKNEVPYVKTGVPVQHRFEGIIFSRTTINDHSIVNIEKKTAAAVEAMRSQEEVALLAPESQSMDRKPSVQEERVEEVVKSLRRCHTLGVSNPKDPAEVEAELESLRHLSNLRAAATGDTAAPAQDPVHTTGDAGATLGDAAASAEPEKEHLAPEGEEAPLVAGSGGATEEVQNRPNKESPSAVSGAPAMEEGDREQGAGSKVQHKEQGLTKNVDTGTPHAATQKWKDVLKRIEAGEKKMEEDASRWERLAASLLEEEEEMGGKQQDHKKPHFLHLPSLQLTGAH